MKARHKDTGEIIELAEEGIISRDGRHFCWHQVELIPEPVDECKPSLHSNMDEAAEEYEDWAESYNQSDFPTCISFRQSFKAGAEWMAGQGLTVEGYISSFFNGELKVSAHLQDNNSIGAKFGDKVTVQIRKKEE